MDELLAAIGLENDEERQGVMATYKMFDRKGDGKLSMEEFIRIWSESLD